MLLVAKHNLNDIRNVKTHKNLLKSEGMLPSCKAWSRASSALIRLSFCLSSVSSCCPHSWHPLHSPNPVCSFNPSIILHPMDQQEVLREALNLEGRVCIGLTIGRAHCSRMYPPQRHGGVNLLEAWGVLSGSVLLEKWVLGRQWVWGWVGSLLQAELRRQHCILKVMENTPHWVYNDKICALEGKLKRLVHTGLNN